MLRENFFSYLKAETTFADAVTIKAGAYYHDMNGRGDWAPPYIVDVLQDGTGAQRAPAGVGADRKWRQSC